ncbi:RNA polymerase sigma factor [Psychrobacillus vulpis]|uniref:RNA polymerase sigma factor n=1 Tax=Psychrobacillus vulpis TaxID=2325572 RepID=UPI001F0FF9B0|nr:RNA polymerase sigma factor [Psychrobacillus vulpis]
MNDFEIANIYKQFSPPIFRYMTYLVQHRQVAEDLTQEVFIRFVNLGDVHRTPAEIQGWLRKTARNIAFDYLRRKRLIKFTPFLVIHEKADEHPFFGMEEVRELYDALGKLKPSYREVIIWRKIEELSIKETAEILNWNEEKVKNTLKRAMQALRLKMGGAEDE